MKARTLVALAAAAFGFAGATAAQQQQGQGDPNFKVPEVSEAKAFKDALDSLILLSPEEIEEVIKRARTNQQTVAKDRQVDLISRSFRVDLAPGARPPQVQLAFGHSTAITIIDSTGAPWPIRAMQAGDDAAVQLTDPQASNANILTVSPKVPFARTNMIATLEGVDTPLVVIFETGGSEANDSVTLQLDRPGPKAEAAIALPPPMRPDDGLMRNLLDGVIPGGVQMVSVQGGDATAYRAGNRLFIRTQGTMRWPAPIAVSQGVDKVKVYEVPPQPLMVVADRQGNIIQLKVSDTGMLLDSTLAARTATAAPGSILIPADPANNPYAPRVAGYAPQGKLKVTGKPSEEAPKKEATGE